MPGRLLRFPLQERPLLFTRIHPGAAVLTPSAEQRETEIKLKVHDRAATEKRLPELGFEIAKPRCFEVNRLFDFPDGRLRVARCVLRVRQEGERWLVTFKGAPVRSSDYKERGEIETEVVNGEGVVRIFESLGLRESFRYEKFRTVYRRLRASGAHEGEVDLDETPIGDYVELEGPRAWIDDVANALGFARLDYVTASYASLYFAWCRERGLEPSAMVFPAAR